MAAPEGVFAFVVTHQATQTADDGDDAIDRWIESRPGWPDDWPAVTQSQLTALIGEALEHWGRPTTPPSLPLNYIDPEHTGQDRELLEVFYRACNAEGGTADEIHLRGIKAVLAGCPATPPATEPGDVGELVELLQQEAGCYDPRTDIRATQFTRAATLLQQQAAELAALRGVPVAVSERLPKEGDCNAEGRCWCYTPPVDFEGVLIMNSRWILSRPDWHDTHWLPCNALPLPAPQAGDVQP